MNSFLKNRTVQHVIKWIVALSFALFTFYQIILAIRIETTRFGRLIGIVFYLVLTVASFLALSKKRRKSESKRKRIDTARMILLITGLAFLFATRLLSVITVFSNLNFSVPASVLNAAVFILSQLGTLALIAGCLVQRSKLTQSQIKRATAVLMSAVIALYAACFVMECVMMIKYGFNVDLSLKFTLISRLWYFIGFAGTAFCFMLPASRGRRKHKEGHFYYAEDSEEEVDLVM